jgi:hypothetical protein
MPSRPIFVITIDTEGDNLWSRPSRVTTENARHLPRFQGLCEAFGFKPTYLVDHEMALDPHFQEFGRALLAKGAGEVGLHIHPWNSPPLMEVSTPGENGHTYLHKLPEEMIHAKLETLTRLIADIFGARPRSHRAGRWGFDERVARVLADLGFLVDCSVTPGVSWRTHRGAPGGAGGPDYSDFPSRPYFLDLTNIRGAGSSPLLEVPVTIRRNYPPRLQRLYQRAGHRVVENAFRVLFGPSVSWLRPNGRNGRAMIELVDWAMDRELPVLEFMLHSSELMPGANPKFRTPEQIDSLYLDLEGLFGRLVSLGIAGITLAEYRATWPAESVGGSPAESVGGSPAESVGGSPAESVGGSPAESVGGSPAESVGGSPDGWAWRGVETVRQQ